MIRLNFKILFSAIVFLLVLTIQASVQAATVVTVLAQGKLNKIMIEGGRARIGTGANDYILVDLQSGQAQMVMTGKKRVILLGQALSSSATNTNTIHTSLKPVGNGPVIAGYRTTRYRWFAKGKICGTLDASTTALKTAGIKPLFDVMRKIIARQRATLGGYAALFDVCTQASFSLAERIHSAGIPMRVTKSNGYLFSEVKSIKTGVHLPASIFAVPTGYQRVALKGVTKSLKQADNKIPQAMQQQFQQIQKKFQQFPQIRQQLQQMQQTGRLTPEAMHQLESLQQMIQQHMGR